MNTINGKQPGDPDRAASAILKVVDAERPPLRLALGSYAIGKVRKKLTSQGTELDEWQALATSTDFAR